MTYLDLVAKGQSIIIIVMLAWGAIHLFRGKRGSAFWHFVLAAAFWAGPALLGAWINEATAGTGFAAWRISGRQMLGALVILFLVTKSWKGTPWLVRWSARLGVVVLTGWWIVGATLETAHATIASWSAQLGF